VPVLRAHATGRLDCWVQGGGFDDLAPLLNEALMPTPLMYVKKIMMGLIARPKAKNRVNHCGRNHLGNWIWVNRKDSKFMSKLR